MKTIRTATLEIAYEESGPAAGRPVILLHGFPDDVHAYDGVAPLLAARGWRVFVPYLRGYGPTRFLDAGTPRSGQQAALGRDLADFMDALGLERAVLAGYDWGGRAACVVAALWPQRAAGLVTIGGYNIQNIAEAANPASPATEYRRWYQWYFHTERGRAGLAANRGPLCRLLWELWSPNYRFDDATYEQTAASFDNADFVEVVIQSYRHRYGVAPGDPALDAIEAQLAQPAADHGPDNRSAGRSRRRFPAGPDRARRPPFYRPLPEPHHTARRPLSAARGAQCRRSGDPRAVARFTARCCGSDNRRSRPVSA